MLLAGIHGLLNSGLKVLVELLDHIGPLLPALGNIIELLLHLGSEIVVQNLREIFHQEIVHHHTDICGEQFSLVATGHFLTTLGRNLDALKDINGVFALLTFLVTFLHVLTLLNGRDGGGVGGRTANAQFLQLMHKRGFRISERTLGETFRSTDLPALKNITGLHRRQHM